jgi:drug/metabolite transporter (DMT)-like permease
MFLDIILLQMLFSCSTPLNKLLLEQSSVLTLTTLRMLCAGLFILYSWFCVRKNSSWLIKREHMGLFTQKIFFGSYLKYVLKYWALQYMSPTHAAFLFFTTPLWSAMYDYVYFDQQFISKQLIGMAVTFLGIVPLLLSQQHGGFITEHIVFLPALALLVAVGAHCYGIMCTKKLMTDHGYDPILISAYSNLGTGCLAFLTAIIMQESFVIINVYKFVPYLVSLIFVSNIVGKIWHTYLLKKHSMTILSLSEYLNPLCVALYSWLFWGVYLSTEQIISGFFIIGGLYIFHSPQTNAMQSVMIAKNL